MRILPLAILSAAFLFAGCASDSPTSTVTAGTGVRVINAFDSSVDVLVDNAPMRSGLASGALVEISLGEGRRTVQVRQVGGTTSSLLVTVAAGRVSTVAATRAMGGAMALTSLADSNAIVPAGASKLRVLHLAAHAGEVQIWRTQPDYQTPIRWAFPVTYNSIDTYYQSTPGTWEVRVWTDTNLYRPGDARGWLTALDTARVTLAGGAKRTVVILDGAGGRVRLALID